MLRRGQKALRRTSKAGEQRLMDSRFGLPNPFRTCAIRRMAIALCALFAAPMVAGAAAAAGGHVAVAMSGRESAFIDQYCSSCHNSTDWAGELALDTLDLNDLGGDMHGEGGDPSAAMQTVDDIKAMGGEAVVNGDNVADWDGAARLVQQAIDAFQAGGQMGLAGQQMNLQGLGMGMEGFQNQTQLQLAGSQQALQGAQMNIGAQEAAAQQGLAGHRRQRVLGPIAIGLQQAERAPDFAGRQQDVQIAELAQRDVAVQRCGQGGSLVGQCRDARPTEQPQDAKQLQRHRAVARRGPFRPGP